MGSLAQSCISQTIKKPPKIPEYAKDFKNEWLYITGINKKCGEVKLIIEDYIIDGYKALEKICYTFKELRRHFKDVLEAQKVGKLQNISKLKLSSVDEIIYLRSEMYCFMGNSLYSNFFFDEEVQDFFEDFIVFINHFNIKYEDDFEDDRYLEPLNWDHYIASLNENETESDREDRERIDRILDSDNESETESETETETETESETESESESERESDFKKKA